MWSTVTLTPTFLPQSLANGSNHLSWLGTKWLQSRMRRSPESLLLGSANVVLGAGSDGAAGAPAGFLPLHAARAPPTATSPEESRKVRRVRSRGSSMAVSDQRPSRGIGMSKPYHNTTDRSIGSWYVRGRPCPLARPRRGARWSSLEVHRAGLAWYRHEAAEDRAHAAAVADS